MPIEALKTEETMTNPPGKSIDAPPPRKRITLERTYQADVRDVWDLWTTADGIESWWGPGGFAVKVRKLDLRPGGELLYAMNAIDAPQVEFMVQAGKPMTSYASIPYEEAETQRR